MQAAHPFATLDLAQLADVTGGAWSWTAFGRATAKNAVMGGIGGAVAGAFTGPGMVASGAIGAVAGAATGAADYTGTQLGIW